MNHARTHTQGRHLGPWGRQALDPLAPVGRQCTVARLGTEPAICPGAQRRIALHCEVELLVCLVV